MLSRLRLFLLALGLSGLLPLAHAELPAPVRQALRDAGVPPQAVSVLVMPLSPDRTSKPRLTHRPDASMNPASVMKLYTTWAGLQLLGPDHVWQTRVETVGSVHNGVLRGTLVLRGAGDPKLVVERVQELMVQIRARGITAIDGDIVLDAGVFDVAPRSEAFDDEPLRPYNVQPDGLLMNFHSVIYTFTPDAASGRARVRSEPPLAGLEVPADVPLLGGPCNDWRRNLQADFSQALRPRFAGGYPASCGERPWAVAFADAPQFAPRMVEALWQQAGGTLSGQVRRGAAPAGARELLSFTSLPLSALSADINKMSNNVMAQQLFLTLSAEMGAPGRLTASQRRLAHWWPQVLPGISPPEMDNGSGLSRQGRTDARALTALLQKAWRAPHAQVFADSLAIAGVDGTATRLAERLPDSPLIGRARLKTGSLRDVAAVAGYVQGESGRNYTVVGLINHELADRARPALTQLLDWVARDTVTSRQ
jgi:D-alanyl-D-alanine carboxypeptidase/D-alanyl-D-alanine-endopeptidase (penicillin-binding protein 4)